MRIRPGRVTDVAPSHMVKESWHLALLVYVCHPHNCGVRKLTRTHTCIDYNIVTSTLKIHAVRIQKGLCIGNCLGLVVIYDT